MVNFIQEREHRKLKLTSFRVQLNQMKFDGSSQQSFGANKVIYTLTLSSSSRMVLDGNRSITDRTGEDLRLLYQKLTGAANRYCLSPFRLLSIGLKIAKRIPK